MRCESSSLMRRVSASSPSGLAERSLVSIGVIAMPSEPSDFGAAVTTTTRADARSAMRAGPIAVLAIFPRNGERIEGTREFKSMTTPSSSPLRSTRIMRAPELVDAR